MWKILNKQHLQGVGRNIVLDVYFKFPDTTCLEKKKKESIYISVYFPVSILHSLYDSVSYQEKNYFLQGSIRILKGSKYSLFNEVHSD